MTDADRGRGIRTGRRSGPGSRRLALATGRVGRLADRLRRGRAGAATTSPGTSARRDRVLLAAGHLATDLGRMIGPQ